MSRIPRSAKVRPIAGNAAHQVFIVIATGATLGLGAVSVNGYMTSPKQETVSTEVGAGRAGQAATTAAAGQNDNDVYTGSIVYMPDNGTLCRQLLFDNETGQFTDNGYVDCDQAIYNGIHGPKHWSAARIEVIATGFRGH